MDAAGLFSALRARDAQRALDLLRAHPQLARARSPEGLGALQLAIYARLPDVVRALLDAGAPVGIHEAAMLDDTPRVRALAAQDRALVHTRAADGGTPLHYAAHFGAEASARALLDLGADASAMAGAPFSNTPLHAACAGGRAALARVLLAAGAKPDALDANGYAPIHVAAAGGHAACVRALLDGGAARGACGPGGKTPLDFARERGHEEAARELADPSG